MPFTIGIVRSVYNGELTQRLLNSAVSAIQSEPEARVGTMIETPGCFELPQAALMLTHREPGLDAIVCLGVIIQGKTDQNSHIARSCAIGVQSVALETGIPLTFGVISAPDAKLAWERTRGDTDRGREAALAALAMARLKNALRNANTH